MNFGTFNHNKLNFRKFNFKKLSFLLTLFFIFFLFHCNQKISDKENTKPVVIKELVKTTKSWDGEKIPTQKIDNPEVTVLHITVQKGVKLGMHHHPVINVGYMIKGTLTVHKENGEKIVLKKGDSIVEVINQQHYGENTGDEEVEIIVVYVGDKGQPITVLKE